MSEIPKIVTQRLRANAHPGDHPDPNAMSAFIEKALGERERDRVVRHLAQCEACREIVSLSLPEIGNFDNQLMPARSVWLSGTIFRWVAVAACFAIVGAAVGLHYKGVDSRAPTAVEATVSRAESPRPEDKNLVNPPSSVSGGLVADKSAPIEQRRDAENGPSTFGPKNRQAEADLSSALTNDEKGKKTVVTAPPQPAAPSFEKRGFAQAGPAAATLADQATRNETAQAVPPRAKDALQESQGAALKLDTDAPVSMKQSDASVPAALAKTRAALPPAHFIPRWTLSAEGALLCSLDSGNTWKTVVVPGQPLLRALSAHGFVIWVGGAKGALYHSQDAGQSWTQVHPVANGEELSGDVIGVEFFDPQGTVTTSSNETWTTTDQGQTWQKK